MKNCLKVNFISFFNTLFLFFRNTMTHDHQSLETFNEENVFVFYGPIPFFLLLSLFLALFLCVYRVVHFTLAYKIIWIQSHLAHLSLETLESHLYEDPSSLNQSEPKDKEDWYQYINKLFLFAEVAGQSLFLCFFFVGWLIHHFVPFGSVLAAALDVNMLRLGILWTFAFYLTDIFVDLYRYVFTDARTSETIQKSIEKQAKWYSFYTFQREAPEEEVLPRVLILKPDLSNVYWNIFHHVVTASALLGFSPFEISDFTLALFLGSVPLTVIYLSNYYFNRKKSPKFLEFVSSDKEHVLQQYMSSEFQTLFHYLCRSLRVFVPSAKNAQEEEKLKKQFYRLNAFLYFFLRIVPFALLIFRMRLDKIKWWNVPIFLMLPIIFLDNLSHAKKLTQKPFPKIYSAWNQMDQSFTKACIALVEQLKTHKGRKRHRTNTTPFEQL